MQYAKRGNSYGEKKYPMGPYLVSYSRMGIHSETLWYFSLIVMAKIDLMKADLGISITLSRLKKHFSIRFGSFT
jgi:hypothetical protein